MSGGPVIDRDFLRYLAEHKNGNPGDVLPLTAAAESSHRNALRSYICNDGCRFARPESKGLSRQMVTRLAHRYGIPLRPPH